MKLSSAIEEGAPFKLSWTRTSWYYNVKAKAKEMQTINQILLEDIEHSEGRLDDSSAGDYLSTLGYEDEEEFDEHDPIVRTLKQIKPIEAITESSVPDPVPLEVEVITAAAPAPVKATPTPTPTVAACVVTEVVVKKKRRSAQEMLEAKEQKIAEKALKKSLKASPPPKASKAKTIAPPTPKASKTKTFTFPVLHEPVRRNHFYDSDGEIVTVKADKLRGY